MWLNNNRGNKHPRYYKTIPTDCVEVCDFNFQEMGLYDLHALIKHILI